MLRMSESVDQILIGPHLHSTYRGNAFPKAQCGFPASLKPHFCGFQRTTVTFYGKEFVKVSHMPLLAGSPSSPLIAWMDPLVCCGHITYSSSFLLSPCLPTHPPETCLPCGPLNCADPCFTSGVLSGRCGCGPRIRVFKPSLGGSAHHLMVAAAYVFTERP